MSTPAKKQHVPVPRETPAFICAECGAVALDVHSVCKPQGRGTKADWCGTQHAKPTAFCFNSVNDDRYRCKN